MGARQNTDLARYRPHAAGVAPVDPPAVAQNRAPDNPLLDILEKLQRDRQPGFVRENLRQLGFCCIELVAAVLLSLRGIRGLDERTDRIAQLPPDLLEFGRFRRQAPRLAGAGLGKVDDRLDDWLELAVAKGHGTEHDLLAEFLGLRFDHQDSFTRA